MFTLNLTRIDGTKEAHQFPTYQAAEAHVATLNASLYSAGTISEPDHGCTGVPSCDTCMDRERFADDDSDEF